MTDVGHREAFRLGDWTIEPQLNRISRGGRPVEVEPKSMAVLVCLAERPGEVISSDALIDTVWQGRPMGDNPVHRCISRLRNALGDDARNPRYIATVQRKGYRLVAPVESLRDGETPGRRPLPRRFRVPAIALLATAVVALAAVTIGLRSGSPGPDPGISVQPFESLGEEPHFAAGITEDIRSGLAGVAGLAVASRGASAQFEIGTDPKTIGDRLEVSWVLEGRVRRDRDKIKVTAQLSDTQSGFVAWSGSYEGVVADIFEIQSHIATAVVNEVVSTFPPGWRLSSGGTDVISAYDEFLLGEAALGRPHDEENLRQARRHFEAALEYDTQYARAHAGLCRTYLAWYVFSDAAGYIESAEKACAAARSLDPSLSEVPVALGRLYRRTGRLDEARAAFETAMQLDAYSVDAMTGLAQTVADQGNAEGAEKVFAEALETRPNEWAIYSRYGRFLFDRGRYAEAARMYQRVVELRAPGTAPLNNLGAALYLMGDLEMAAKAYEESLRIRSNRSALSNLGTLYYYLGQYERAIEQYRLAIDLRPQDFVMWGNLGDALSRSDGTQEEWEHAYEQAATLAGRQLAINPDDGETRAMLAAYRAQLGQRNAAMEEIDRALALAGAEPYVRYYAAVVFAVLGLDERALDSLEKAVSSGYPASLVRVDPEFAGLRSHSRFDLLFSGPVG